MAALRRKLGSAIADQLRRTGETRTAYRSHEERDRLRRHGLAAGRMLQRPVRTFDVPSASRPGSEAGPLGTVTIVLTDWGATPLRNA